MQKLNKRQLTAWVGILSLSITFILGIVFLLSGQTTMAIVMIASNGFLAFMIYFLLRFHKNVEENNPDLVEKDKEN